MLVEVQACGAVRRSLHVPEAVGLDQVAQRGVDREPARDEAGQELQVLDRPAMLEELGLEVLVRAPLPHVHVVMDQGVVHVVADGFDGPQVERAVRKQPPAGRRWHGRKRN